jgi:hypothetical protein
VQAGKDYFSKRKVEQDEQTLIEKRNQLIDKISTNIKLLEVYKNEEAMLVKNQAIGGQAGVKTAELKEALDLQRQRLTEVYQKQLEVEKRITAEQQDRERITAQLQEISKKKDSVNYAVTALIESKETRTIKFQVSYTVKDAGWYPAYDMRVTDVAQPLNVLINANVFQRSGETWKDAELLLSTGNPADNATPSQLQPWMLGFYDPSVAWLKSKAVQPGTAAGRVVDEQGQPIYGATIQIKGTRTATLTDANGFFKMENFPVNGVAVVSSVGYNSKEIALKTGYFTIQLSRSSQELSEVVVVTGYGLEGRAAGLDVNENTNARKKEEIQTVTIATQYQPTSTIYKIEDRYTIETDGKTTTIGIKQFTVPALYEYYSAPKIDPSVFLTAKVVNWQEYELQSGEASLYFEGTFLGKTYIDLDAASDTLSVPLGKDNSIKVSRKLVKELSSKKLIGSSRTETKQYEISVRNTKKVPVALLLQDQYPIAINKEIDVDNVKATDAAVDENTGIASWNVALAPGQEKKVQLTYSVKYPKDKKVVVD